MISSRLGIVVALKEHREARKLTYKTIADEAGVSKGTIARLMNNFDGVDKKTLNALCGYLSCGVGDLLEYTPETVLVEG